MNEPLPTVSVVVATHQRAGCLESVLGEVLDNVAPAAVVVVDDGSTDGTAELLRRLASEHPRLQAVSQPNAGGWLALLAGARAAASDVVLLLDDDVVPEEGVARVHAERHAEETGLIVVGYMPVPSARPAGDSWARDLYSQAYEQHCRGWEAQPDTVLESLWAGHVSVRRADLLALAGRLDDAPRGYHRDLDLGLCAAEAGLRGRFDRDLGSRHLYERSPEQFATNARSSGESMADVIARHGATLEGPPLEPLPRGVTAVARRPRGDGALRALISVLGAVHLFRVQRSVGRRWWRVLQSDAFARRSNVLQAGDPRAASNARR